MRRVPGLSIASKLYAIFALLATATVVLALVAVVSARRHAALTDEFELALQGSQNVERINGLIYAAVMESRGVYMSEDAPARKKYADGLLQFNGQIAQIVNAWERTVGPDHADQFRPFAARIRQFTEFRKELARRGVEVGQAAGREWGDNDASRTVRVALNNDLNRLGASYAKQARDTYAKIDSGIDVTAWLMSLFGGTAILLGVLGALVLRQSVLHPLAQMTRLAEQVADGHTVAIPSATRRDEIGALWRLIGVFQDAMHRNQELNRTVLHDAKLRSARQEHMSAEIAAFT